MNDEQYRLVGMSSALTGLQLAIELLQSELEQIRNAVGQAIQNGAVPLIKRKYTKHTTPLAEPEPEVKSKPVSRQAKGMNNYWGKMTPEERSAEMNRRLQLAKARKGRKARRAAAKKVVEEVVQKAQRVAKQVAAVQPKPKPTVKVERPLQVEGDYSLEGLMRETGLPRPQLLRRLKQHKIKARRINWPGRSGYHLHVYAADDAARIIESTKAVAA